VASKSWPLDYNYAIKLLPQPLGGFYLASYASSGFAEEKVLLHFDANQALSATANIGQNLLHQSVAVATDGSVYVSLTPSAPYFTIGGQEQPNDGYTRIVTKVTEDLAYIWHVILRETLTVSVAASSKGVLVAARPHNSNLEIAGVALPPCEPVDSPVILVMFGPDGEYRWARAYGAKDLPKLTSDDTAWYASVGESHEVKNATVVSDGLYFMRISMNGDLDWIQTIPGSAFVHEMVPGSGSGLIAAGTFAGQLGTPKPLTAGSAGSDFVLYMK
jgi:hypothetical protein